MKPVNPKISGFVTHFGAHYNGKPWYGDSLITILDEVDSTQAFWQPKSSAHCIAQIVAHIIYWRMSLIKKLEGDTTYKPSMQSEDNWKDISSLKKLGWKKLNNELAVSQKKLIDLLSCQKDTLLKRKYSEKATYEGIIHGILQHDIYHIGQIAYLKSLAKSK
jgi:uncharacterized damage-inducible protein DinB